MYIFLPLTIMMQEVIFRFFLYYILCDNRITNAWLLFISECKWFLFVSQIVNNRQKFYYSFFVLQVQMLLVDAYSQRSCTCIHLKSRQTLFRTANWLCYLHCRHLNKLWNSNKSPGSELFSWPRKKKLIKSWHKMKWNSATCNSIVHKEAVCPWLS